MAICPSQLGQIGALWGMRHLGDWLASERAEILRRRAATERAIAALPGWRLKSAGAYFAWVEHPWSGSSQDLAREMVGRIGVLALPGTMFTPPDDPDGRRHLRLAFANIDSDGVDRLAERLAQIGA